MCQRTSCYLLRFSINLRRKLSSENFCRKRHDSHLWKESSADGRGRFYCHFRRSIGERRSRAGLASTGLLADRLWQVKKSCLPEGTLLDPEFLRSEEHDGCSQQTMRTNVRQRTRNLELFSGSPICQPGSAVRARKPPSCQPF